MEVVIRGIPAQEEGQTTYFICNRRVGNGAARCLDRYALRLEEYLF